MAKFRCSSLASPCPSTLRVLPKKRFRQLLCSYSPEWVGKKGPNVFRLPRKWSKPKEYQVHELSCKYFRAPPKKKQAHQFLGPPVERLEYGYQLSSVVYFSRETLPKRVKQGSLYVPSKHQLYEARLTLNGQKR